MCTPSGNPRIIGARGTRYCGCGCGCGPPFRRFVTSKEELERLEEYQDQLKKELDALKEYIQELEKK